MTSSLATTKTWMSNSVIKRVILVFVGIIIFKYAVYDLSSTLSSVIAMKPIRNSQRALNIYNFDPTFTNDSGLNNATSSEAKMKTHDEKLAAIIAKDKLASGNKGVYLPFSEETRNRVWKINEGRKQTANDVCAGKNLRKGVTLDNVRKIKRYTNVAVDDKHKLLYCYVPKVGCTSWKVKLALMSDNAGNTVLNTHPTPVDSRGGLARYGIKMLSTYTPEQIKYRIENYYKFVFVRHPMERIVSSYRSKFEKRKDNSMEYPWFYGTYGNQIRNAARKNKTDTKSDITFEEFVTFLIKRSGIAALTDDHWEQYNKICHLCLIDYDFIGKFDENMVDDISYVLRQISADEKNYWFPNVTAPRSATKHLEKYFRNIPTTLIDNLEEGYSLDFELFDFDKGLSAKLNKTNKSS